MAECKKRLQKHLLLKFALNPTSFLNRISLFLGYRTTDSLKIYLFSSNARGDLQVFFMYMTVIGED
jgi:hypothetical protein